MKSPEAIYNEAYQAAVAAANAADHSFHGACGFAWVKITPARGKLVTWLKKNGIGSKSYNGGYDIWNPCGAATQSMHIKEAGAAAFAKVLKDNGITAYAQSRMD